MTYTVGEIIEVCLGLDLPPTGGIRRIEAVFVNEHGEAIELTDVPHGRRSASCKTPRRPRCGVGRPIRASTSCGC